MIRGRKREQCLQLLHTVISKLGESVAWRFMSKPARDEGLIQLLEVFMSCESFQLLGTG